MKSKNDLTKGNVTKGIILFALPILFGNLFQQIYNLADTSISGHFLGDDALAAIGSCASLFNFLMYFVGGLNGGFSLVMARFYGEKNEKKLKNSMATMIGINVISTVIIMLLAITLLKPILHLINIPQEIFQSTYSYILIIFLGVGITTCYNAQASLLRALGNSFMPIIFLIISSVCNVILDIVLISVFHLGVKGAALATIISQFLSVILCQIAIRKSYKDLRLSKEDFCFSKEMYKEMFSAGITMALMNCIFALGSLIQQGAINSLGKTIIAGHLAARKIIELFMQPMNTIAAACSTMVSQCYGANKIDRIKKAIKASVIMELIMSATFILIIYLFSTSMIWAVTGTENANIVNTARMYLMINIPFMITLGILYVMRTSIQSIGKRIPPLLSSSIELGMKIFGAFYLVTRFGYKGICFAEPISWVLGALLITTAFVKAMKHLASKP